jgi:hypothetical protein
MVNLKRKVVNVRTGKVLELSDVAIANLKKMGKFSDYDILPEPVKLSIDKEPTSKEFVEFPIPVESDPEPTSETPSGEVKKKKKKSLDNNLNP